MSDTQVVYRILFGGDLHKRMRDIATIRGYCKACTQIQLDIMDYIRENGVTDFYSLGDWFDGGYGSDVAAALVHTELDSRMSRLLNGNFYGLIGNHIRIKMDSNPELFLIQPHPYYTSSHTVSRKEQIIKTPTHKAYEAGGKVALEIHLQHWNPVSEGAKDYAVKDDVWKSPDSYKITLFHTEEIIPGQLLSSLNMGYEISNETVISNALGQTDLALVGHIHKVIGKHLIKDPTGLKSTLLYVPGSLMNTDSGMRARHDHVDLPVVDVLSDGSVKVYEYSQSLHLEMQEFFVKTSEENAVKLKSLRGNTLDTLYGDMEASAFIGDSSSFVSLNTFFERQGYTQNDKALCKTVIKSPEDINVMREIYKSEGEDVI